MTRNRIQLISSGLAVATIGVVVVLLVSQPPSRTLPPEFVRAIPTQTGSFTHVRFDPEGTSLLAGGATGTVVTVTLDPDRVEQLAPATDDPLTCLTESPDGLILAASVSGRLRAWTRPELNTEPVSSPKVTVTAVTFGIERTERRLVLGLSDGRLLITAPDGDRVCDTKHRGIKALLTTSDGTTLISAGSEGLIQWLDGETGSPLGEFKEHRTEVSALEFSPDATRFAAGDWNGGLRILDVKSRRELARAQQPEAVSGLAWRNERLISAAWDGRLRLWSVSGDKLTLDREIDTGQPIHGLAVNPEGTLAATVCGTSAIELWRLTEMP